MMEKSLLDRPLCLLCLAAAQEITHAVNSLSRLGELHSPLQKREGTGKSFLY